MKKFLKYFIILISPFFLGFFFLELFYRFEPNNYTVKHQLILKEKDAEILLLGNSHVLFGLNPIYFSDKTINLSNVSQSIYFDELLFEKHQESLKKLKVVVLNIDYFTLSKQDNSEEDLYRKYYYKHYMQLEVPTINRFDKKQYFLSSTKSPRENYKLIKEYFHSNQSLVTCDRNGWGFTNFKEKKLNIQTHIHNTLTKHEDKSMDFALNSSRIKKIVEACQKKNIKVVLVTMPVCKEYSSGVNQLKKQKIFKTCSEFTKCYENTFYLNLFEDARFSNEDFFDPDHLHHLGAKKCSEILNEFIAKL